MLKAEFPKSYKAMVNYLASDTPMGNLTPAPSTIVRYILTTLPGYDPIAAMLKDLEEVQKCQTSPKKKRKVILK
jgi:hypothetical protein